MRRRMPLLIPAVVALALVPALAQTPPASGGGGNDDEKVLYAIGLALSQRLADYGLTEADLSHIQSGLADGVLGRTPKYDLEEWGPKIDAMLEARRGAFVAKEKAAGDAFLAEAAKQPGAVKTDSGLIYVEAEVGTGAQPTETDTVKIHYTGRFRDGRVFDSSKEGEPATFPLGGVIPCFREGLSRMKVGGKAKLICPSELAYGEQGMPPFIPPSAVLTFEVELLDIVPPEAAAEEAPESSEPETPEPSKPDNP